MSFIKTGCQLLGWELGRMILFWADLSKIDEARIKFQIG
jgi:hypothetical protein